MPNVHMDYKRRHRRMAMRILKRTFRNTIIRQEDAGWHQGCMIGITQCMFASGLVNTRQLAMLEDICLGSSIFGGAKQ